MSVGQGVSKIEADGFVKLVVLLSSDVAFRTGPQSIGLVHVFPLTRGFHPARFFVPFFFQHLDGQGNVIGIFGQNALQFPARKQFILICFQVQNDLSATVCFLNGFHAEFAITFRFPFNALCGRQTGFARAHRNFVSHNERRIKTHAKLAYQGSVFLLIATQFAKKFFGTTFGDRAQVFNSIFAA